MSTSSGEVASEPSLDRSACISHSLVGWIVSRYSYIPLHGPDRTGPDQTKSAASVRLGPSSGILPLWGHTFDPSGVLIWRWRVATEGGGRVGLSSMTCVAFVNCCAYKLYQLYPITSHIGGSRIFRGGVAFGTETGTPPALPALRFTTPPP